MLCQPPHVPLPSSAWGAAEALAIFSPTMPTMLELLQLMSVSWCVGGAL